MKINWAVLASIPFFFGCGLDTSGNGPGDDDQSQIDVPAEEVEPDIAEADVPETDAADDIFDLAEEDVSPETPDEASPEADAEEADEIGPEDIVEDESGEEGGDAEDSEVVDPCARPDIPATGIYMFFCFADDLRANMALSLQIERGGLPIFPWAEILDCTETDTRSMFCELPPYYNSVYIFNVQFSLTHPGTGAGWTCGPSTDGVLWGVPRVWVNHVEQVVTTRANTEGSCNHLFTTPPGP